MTEPRALYVDTDDYCVAWLRNLISRGLIADGDVTNTSVVDLRPSDLAGYRQVHLYAGIGVWSYSLRRAGIPDTANVWTFSEPCQPFSAAGKGLGFADERYLRPFTHHLVSQCRPAICLGEQVASKDGLAWLDVVQSDMEGTGYAFGPSDTCSAGFGAPHIRQRLRFAAYQLADMHEHGRNANAVSEFHHAQHHIESCGGAQSLANNVLQQQSLRLSVSRFESEVRGRFENPIETAGLCIAGQLADARSERIRITERGTDRSAAGGDESEGGQRERLRPDARAVGASELGILADADHNGLQGRTVETILGTGRRNERDAPGCSGASLVGHNSAWTGPTNGFWSNADWLHCRDGKWRPVEPGTFPLAHGASSRVGRLRAYGNAVDAEATTEFCREAFAALSDLAANIAA